MIRFLRAFVWYRYRVLRNAFRARGGRDGLERASRMGAVIAPVVIALLLVPLTLGLSVLGALGGWAFAADEEAGKFALLVARALLGMVTAVTVLGAVVRSAGGSISSMTRLTLLPIPRRAILVSEILAGVTDPWIAVPLPALLLFCVGLLVGGLPGTALVAAVATILLVLTLVTLAAALSFVVQLLFRDRRRGEVLSLVGAVALAMAGFLPLAMHETFDDRRLGRSEAAREFAADGRTGGLLVVTQVLPSEMWARAVRATAGGRPVDLLAGMAGLAALGGTLFAVASAAHRRLLDSPAAGSGRRGARLRATGGPRLPLLSPRVAAVAWVQMRALLRTLTGRMAVFLNPVLVLLLALVFPRFTRELPLEGFPIDRGVLFAAVGGVFTLISVERLLLNQFAVDGAGFTLQMLSPLSDREIVRGKMAGGAVLGALSYAILLVFLVPVTGGLSPIPLLAVVLGLVSVYVVFAPLAAILAAILPKAADLNRMGNPSNPHGLANLVGFLMAKALCAPPAALFFFGAVLRGSDALGCALVATWTAVACAVSLPLVRLAAATLTARRENVAMVAQGR